MRPVAVGLAVGLLLVALPEGIGPVIVVVGALVAGWVLPTEPMVAALLYLLPAIVLGGIRLLLDDGSVAMGALLFGLVIGVAFVAIFTHVGAGIALRHQS